LRPPISLVSRKKISPENLVTRTVERSGDVGRVMLCHDLGELLAKKKEGAISLLVVIQLVFGVIRAIQKACCI
jgi:hypothetical protein